MDQEEQINKAKNPREGANIFRILTFWFAFPILKKARKTDITEKDIYQVLPKHDSKKLGDKLEAEWLRGNQGKQKTSFTKCVVKSFVKYYIFLGFIQLVMRVGVLTILQPKAMSKFVAYFQKNQTTVTKNELFGWAASVIGINVLLCVYNHNFMQAIGEYAISIRTSICSVIYRKALKISPLAFSDSTMGKVVTLITKDVFSIDGALVFLNDIWIGMVQTLIVTIVLYKKIGYSVFAGIGFILLVIPVQAFCARTASLTRLKTAKKTEERLQIGNELLSAIKTIKMFTWEKYFEKLMTAARMKETSNMKIIYYLKSLILTLGGLTLNIALFLVIIVFISTGHQASAEIVSLIQMSFFALRSFITVSIPLGIAQTADLSAALKRIGEFLNLEEFVTNRNEKSSVENPRVYLNKVSMHIKDKEILRSVSFELEKGLLIISGNLGSGKSSLLKTILNEYPISSGALIVKGNVSYAPEEPWLFPSTIKQNILFGQPYIEKRYHDVIRACALTYDLGQFEDDDETVVGDKGVNLSKGQKARISLARAVYKKSDIYLLDDCLSALDGEVNKHVFRECIKSFLKDKICILITNNFNNIKEVPISNVLYMEDGKTLDLDQQRGALDKRITYYIDEDNNQDHVADEAGVTENNLEDQDEKDTLLIHRRISQARKSIYYEEPKKGKVLLKNYLSYYKYTGGLAVLIFILLLFLVTQITQSMSDKFLKDWINVQDNYTALIKDDLMDTDEFKITSIKRAQLMNLYSIMILLASGFALMRAFANFYFCTKAGRNLHNVLVTSILHAYMTFFDFHFKGHILNRLSKDIHTIDETVPFVIYENMRSVFLITAKIILIASVFKLFLIPSAMLFIVLFFIQRFYIPTGRSIKRLEAASRSPMVGYVNASLEGLTTVRACEQEEILKFEFDRHQDNYTSVFYMNMSTSRWFAFVLDLLCGSFIAVIVLRFTIFSEGVLSGDVMLAVTQAMGLTGILQFAVRQAAELENTMTSVERILEYADIEKEPKTGAVLNNWPRTGAIKFKNVKLQYKTTGEIALKNVNFEIEGKSKIGIVGRTGAGKSSIISALFRLYDFKGQIIIDGEDISSLNLQMLRSKIAIIPQDPILFAGTIRSNIDPLNVYDDDVIWKAIEKVQIKGFITSLDQKITNVNNTFSAGQKQLLCLARALISDNKIIVLDEATASIDPTTDQTIQKTIKENFEHCTVLTIAHRLNTFTKSDKILVVEDGIVVQFNKPQVLLQDKEGAFYRMVKEAGQNIFF